MRIRDFSTNIKLQNKNYKAGAHANLSTRLGMLDKVQETLFTALPLYCLALPPCLAYCACPTFESKDVE